MICRRAIVNNAFQLQFKINKTNFLGYTIVKVITDDTFKNEKKSYIKIRNSNQYSS